MRLKKLIVHGFKSFADRTEFVFDSPITGIVGPNGCGKSNVVDAVKWVMGEQSAKSLRGDAMLDVIFNGSGSRKPAGMAEVTLVFDNPRREDGSRAVNVDQDEISVGRRLYRDGTSEYQLNNTAARLKDIRETFLDTGVGGEAYSIIEQGKVAAMLESNPAERRAIFEEAAGISKYKAKKKETERKLEKVDANLLRVTDIVEEVEKRLRSVKVQAAKARNYQEYSTRLTDLRLQYVLQEYHVQQKQLDELIGKRDDLQFRLDDLQADLTRKQTDLTEKREQFDRLSQKRQATEYELVQARAQVDSARQRQEYARQQIAQIGEQLESFASDQAQAEQRLEQVRQQLTAEQQQFEQLTAELSEQRRLIEERQNAFREGQLSLNKIAQEIEQNKSRLLDLMRLLGQTGSRLGAIEIERKNIAGHQSRLSERRRLVVDELAELDEQRSKSEQKLSRAEMDIQVLQLQSNQRKREAAELGQQIQQIAENLSQAREQRSALVSRQNLLKDLEQRREGVSEGVKSVLRQREGKFAFVQGLVADLIRVDVEHAHVIEAALDGRDQLLVTDNSAALSQASGELANLEGRVNFLCRDRLPAFENGYHWNQHPQHIRLAIDLVKVDPADLSTAEHLLGKTVVVESLADAEELQRIGPRGYRYVTTAGEVIESDGLLRAGPLTAAMGLISRRSELDAIAAQVAEVDSKIEKLNHTLSQSSQQAKSLEEGLNTLSAAIYQSNTIRVELQSKIARIADQQNQFRREQPILEKELQQLMDQVGRLTAEELQLAEKKLSLESEQTHRQEAVQQLTTQHEQTNEELKQTAEMLTTTRVQLGQIQEKQLSSRQQVERHESDVRELTEQAQRIEASRKQLSQRLAGIESELEKATAAESELQEKQERLAKEVEELTTVVAALQETVSQLSAQVEEFRGTVSQTETDLHRIQMSESETRVRQESMITRAREELNLDLPARYNEAPYEPADLDWDSIANEIKELKEKIARLGNINLDSLAEQDELENREKFLRDQVTDLTTSKEQLQQLIEQINVESSARFEATFQAVRDHFQGIFRKLFGGGSADIILETSVEDPAAAAEMGLDGKPIPVMRKVDALDAGIEIIARPPGKKPVSISQLSGGEKTMTCVALLMSIFKSKPSPFCILDECDAALDEANNQRFNRIIQEFLDQSQFIVITHSKRTMQIADVLYGVTMQEQGVSRRVAVKFDQIDSQGRVSAEAMKEEATVAA
ncbi:MAG TPA: chromosome segregation protein SMC [Tepidisphaeraceae bacterium]